MVSSAFSEQGEVPSDFERMLVERFGADEPRHTRQLWLLIGQRIGIENLAIVLDELGGMTNLSVPTRRTFFGDLYQSLRNAEIRQRIENGQPNAVISCAMGVSVDVVAWVRRAHRVRCGANRDTTRRWNKRKSGVTTR